MLHTALNLSNTLDATIYAITCISFWSQCTLIELCLDDTTNMRRHASRGTTQKNGVASNGLTYSKFFAPWTKMKPQGEWIYWTCSGCLCSADKAFNNHLM